MPPDIIAQLATSLGRRDEVPNQQLAAKIVGNNEIDGINELVANLENKNKGIRSDCIKVLYEVGYTNPKMIAGHTDAFLKLLDGKDNRLQWGAMIALGCIVKEKPAEIFEALPTILNAANKGSVITRDHSVNILISLSATKSYAHMAFPLLLEQILRCPTNQLPMYAEKALPVVNAANRDHFVKVVVSRLDEVKKESQRKRMEKLIRTVTRSMEPRIRRIRSRFHREGCELSGRCLWRGASGRACRRGDSLLGELCAAREDAIRST
ncbi:MAG: hypothetical protein ACJ72Z_08200 [Pyrinomonadaceae bacterium]